MLKKFFKFYKSENGGSAVEFALLLPLLMAIIMGIIQFGFIFFDYISITHAAREGARWASLENPEASTISKVITAAPGLSLTAGNVKVDPKSPGLNEQGQPVTVTINYATPIIVPFVFANKTNIPMSVSATQKIE